MGQQGTCRCICIAFAWLQAQRLHSTVVRPFVRMHHGKAKVLKRPASRVSSTADSPLSEDVVVELKATHDVNNLRKRAKQLGVLVDYQTPDGQWQKRS